MIGPTYKRPSVPLTPAFKEAPPSTSAGAKDGWEPGHPSDTQLKGNWWKMYGDSGLDTLEAKVDTANQTLKGAAANFQAARAQLGSARSYEAPTLSVGPSVGSERESTNRPYALASDDHGNTGDFNLPIDLNYEIDLWGASGEG